MSIDFSALKPKLNDWFSPNLEYRGEGKATFSKPPGDVSGSVIIHCNENGEVSIVMHPQSYEAEPELMNHKEAGLTMLLDGSRPESKGEGKGIKWSVGLDRNTCTSLEISVAEPQPGKLTFVGDIFYQNPIFPNTDNPLTIRFSPIGYGARYEYVVEDAGPAKYWIIPLSNFTGNFEKRSQSRNSHPLRIFITPEISDGLSQEEVAQAHYVAHSKNDLIIFDFNGKPGFIEGLPDYRERKERLLAKQERHLITAVMVGEVGDKSIEFNEMGNWFPFGFLPLLGFLTGSEVGLPWIEFRDENCNLVKRVHARWKNPAFLQGDPVVNDYWHSASGHLLSKYSDDAHLSEADRNCLLKVLGQLAQTANNDRDVDVMETSSYIFRAFDTLYKHYQPTLHSNKPAPFDRINSALTIDIKKILETAKNELSTLNSRVANAEERQALQTIMDRVGSAGSNYDGNFGYRLEALLKHEDFVLYDSQVLENHYTSNPIRYQNRTWLDDVSRLRNAFAHDGVFKFSSHEEAQHIICTIRHLHDILIRIVFKLLDYNGNYLPRTLNHNHVEAVDWVKPNFGGTKLGYK
jgi:hypothetical protein